MAVLASRPASVQAQQTIERNRNRVACDDWFNGANCTATAPANADTMTTGRLPALAGTRNYTVTPADCDGDGTVGDCLQMQVTVNWTPPQ